MHPPHTAGAAHGKAGGRDQAGGLQEDRHVQHRQRSDLGGARGRDGDAVRGRDEREGERGGGGGCSKAGLFLK